MDYSTLTYTIREFVADIDTILVEFDGAPPFPIVLPISNGSYPTGVALERLIRAHTPIAYYEAQAAKTAANNAADIEALVVPPL